MKSPIIVLSIDPYLQLKISCPPGTLTSWFFLFFLFLEAYQGQYGQVRGMCTCGCFVNYLFLRGWRGWFGVWNLLF